VRGGRYGVPDAEEPEYEVEKFEEFSKLLPARTDGEHSWTVERKEIEARVTDAIAALRKML